MKKITSVILTLTIMFFQQNVFSQNIKKADPNAPKTVTVQITQGISAMLTRKYNLQSVRTGTIGGNINIELFDPHTNTIAKDLREKRAHEAAQMAKEFILSQPNGANMMKTVNLFEITFLKVPAGGITVPNNIIDEFSYKAGKL